MSREADLRYDRKIPELSQSMRWNMEPSKEEAEIQIRILDHYIEHPRESTNTRDVSDVDGGNLPS